MGSFAWRRRMTRHFGEQWTPFAELRLLTSIGRWHTFSVQIDTGAVISVMPRSTADLLGIELERGEAIDLAGVSAPRRPYYVHRVQAELVGLPVFDLRVAIADREEVPNLLGRLDMLDYFQIILDPSRTESRFSLPLSGSK